MAAILFPLLGRMKDSMAKVSFFIGFEKRFQLLAKILLIVVGVTGILLFLQKGSFASLTGEETGLLGHKIFVWLFYLVLLFGAEKPLTVTLVSSKTTLKKAFKRMSVFHWAVLVLSLIAVAAGIRLVIG